jgi:hypothetical protein
MHAVVYDNIGNPVVVPLDFALTLGGFPLTF